MQIWQARHAMSSLGVFLCVCEGGLFIIKIKNQRIFGGLKVNPGDTEVSAFDKSFPPQTRDCKKKRLPFR